MPRRALPILIVLIASIASVDFAAAQDVLLSLHPADEDSVESHTRQAVIFALVVENLGTTSRTLSLDPDLPEGWKALAQESGFTVEPSATEVHIVSVLVPSGTPAGSYDVLYRVKDLSDPAAAAECRLKVVVLPEISLGVKRLESPAFVIAGTEYVASFVITNSGNTEAQADISVESGASLPFEIRGLGGTAVAAIAAGGAAQFSVAVRTDAHLQESMRHPLQVTVRLRQVESTAAAAAGPAAESPEVRAASVVEIVPLTVDSRALTHTIQFDSETTATAGYDQEFNGGIQQEISGRGTLDQAGVHHVEMDLIKQFGTGIDPLLNPLDRYSFQYESRFGQVNLGDLPYTVSPLIAMDRFGRGAQGTLNLFPFRIGAVYFKDAWSSAGDQVLGGSADFTIPRQGDWNDPRYRVGISAVAPLDGRSTFDVFQQYSPAEKLQFQADAAVQRDDSGAIAPAVLALSQGELGVAFWTARYVRAWPDFVGMYSDNQSLLGMGGVRLLDARLNIHGTVFLSDSNLLLSTALPHADRTWEIGLGAGGDLPGWKTKLRFDWETWRREDRLPAGSYRTWDTIFRLGAIQPLAPFKLGLDSMLDFGLDEKNSVSSFSQAHAISFSYAPAESTEYGISLRYSGRLDSAGQAPHVVGTDLSARYAFGQTQIEGQLSDSFSFTEIGFSGAQVGINGRLTHAFPWGHSLSVRPDAWLEYSSDAWVPSFSLELTYGVPFDVPVSRNPDTAIVSGRVFNADTGKPIAGVVLRLDGLAAITNQKGEYTFYLPHSGTEYLQVDMRTVGVGLVPVRPMPMQLQAPGGSKVNAEIGLAQGCTITGNVGEYGFPDPSSALVPSDQAGNGTTPVEPVRTRLKGLANVIVELTDGTEPHRKLTSPTGDFSFEEIRPGRYALQIIEGNLPDHTTVDPKVLDLELTSGEKRTVEFRVLQEQRQIKMIDSPQSLQLETSPGVKQGDTIILQ